jgi:hypothetical protein
MIIFNIIVGISTIISCVFTAYSAWTLHYIKNNIYIENSGSANTSIIQQNNGINNQNSITENTQKYKS